MAFWQLRPYNYASVLYVYMYISRGDGVAALNLQPPYIGASRLVNLGWKEEENSLNFRAYFFLIVGVDSELVPTHTGMVWYNREVEFKG